MVGQRDDQMLCFTYTAPMIDRPIVVCDVDIDEFQGVVAQLPNDFSMISGNLHFISLIRRLLKCLPIY